MSCNWTNRKRLIVYKHTNILILNLSARYSVIPKNFFKKFLFDIGPFIILFVYPDFYKFTAISKQFSIIKIRVIRNFESFFVLKFSFIKFKTLLLSLYSFKFFLI